MLLLLITFYLAFYSALKHSASFFFFFFLVSVNLSVHNPLNSDMHYWILTCVGDLFAYTCIHTVGLGLEFYLDFCRVCTHY